MKDMEGGLKRQINGVHSELLSQTNAILTLQHDVLRIALARETAP